jgi:predicted O-methyltransferase YrrM
MRWAPDTIFQDDSEFEEATIVLQRSIIENTFMKGQDLQNLLDPSQVSKRTRLDPLRCYLSFRRLIEPHWYRRFWQLDPWTRFVNGDATSFRTDCSHEESKILLELDEIESAVTAEQAAVLYCLARQAPSLGDIVEIGSDQGKSTITLALGAKRSEKPCDVHAVDPFLGGSVMTSSQREELLRSNLSAYRVDNVVLHPVTSGEYRRQRQTPIRLMFVDAAHDYLNSSFDFLAWKELIAPGGFLAAHDVDNYAYGPGTRNAFFDCVLQDPRFRLACHMDNLAVAQRITA